MHVTFFKRAAILAGLMLFLSAYNLSGQITEKKADTLSGAVIIGSKEISKINNSAPVSVINKEQISVLGLQSLSEAVRMFAGITVRDYGGIGGLKTVSIRSLGSQHTTVSYDGIAVANTQSGQVDISRFSLDNVEQVSISIGQSDEIFQPAKMFTSAGILNINTSKPVFHEKNHNIHAKITGASFKTVNPTMVYEHKLNNKWSASVLGNYLISNGVYPFKLVNGSKITNEKRNNSDIKTLRGETNLYGELGKWGKINLKAYLFNSERGLPGVVILYNPNANERLWDKIYMGQIGYENILSEKWAIKGQLKYSYIWNKYIDIGEKYNGGKVEDRYTQTEYYGSAMIRYSPVNKIKLILSQDLSGNTLRATIPECPDPVRISSYTAAAFQYESGRVTATVSLLGVYTHEKVVSGNASADRKKVTPSLSASYKLFQNKNIRIRASYRDGYRIPTFNELYYARIGNTSLLPEKAKQYNMGITWAGELFGKGNTLEISTDAYYNKIKDKIVAIPTMFIWRMLNMGKVEIKGIDFSLSAGFYLGGSIKALTSATYSYQNAIDLTNPESKSYRNQIPYTPLHSGCLTASLFSKYINMAYSMNASGERWRMPQNIADNRIEPYLEHSIAVNKNFSLRKCEILLKGEIINLTNINYEIIRYYPMPGRSYRITIDIKL